MTISETLRLTTSGNGDMHDMTDRVRTVVRRSKIKTGMVNVFVVGSTAAVGAIEFEPGLKRDLPELLNKIVPAGRQYGHEQTWHDGNAHSHLQATMLGPQLTVPVREGDLVVGTWQQIILLECDVRARDREVVLTVMGE